MTEIDTYLKILTPAYILNLQFQKNSSTIGEVIPRLISLVNRLETLKTTPAGLILCQHLVSYIKERFKYELESPIYRVIFKFKQD